MPQSYQEQSLIIAKLLYQFSLSPKRGVIKNYYSNIHNAFYKLKQSHPNLFDRLFFDTNGHLPYSKDLNDIIQDFQVSGMINKLNPGFNTLIINQDETKALIEEKKNEIPDLPVKELEEMVVELAL